MIVQEVLNNKAVLRHVYRKLSIPHLLGGLGRCDSNLLLIGREHSWLVNARTSHKRHFVGTRKLVGLTAKAGKNASWTKLEEFALRHAAPGSIVKVFCLHPDDGIPRKVSEFVKAETMPYQAPGCNKDAINGIKLPVFIKTSIEKVILNSEALIGWENSKEDVLEALSGKRRPEPHAEATYKMIFAEDEAEGTQEVQISTCLRRN